MKFGTWLDKRRVSDNPRGDFIKDARDDRRMPEDFATFDELHSYLSSRRACWQAIEVAGQVWNEYAEYVGKPSTGRRQLG
jgi:uncharacterized protein YozE (UPF0346 family)